MEEELEFRATKDQDIGALYIADSAVCIVT